MYANMVVYQQPQIQYNRGLGESSPERSNFSLRSYSTPKIRTEDSPNQKLQRYDGKSQWKSFHMQLKALAFFKDWSLTEKLHNIRLCLKDKAFAFYPCHPITIPNRFPSMIEKLEKHSGKKIFLNLCSLNCRNLSRSSNS